MFDIPADVHRAIVDLARRNGVSQFMVTHAAFAVLLSRLSGATDLAIGIPIAGRGERALDDLIGMFVNTLVLRTEIDPDATIGDLLAQVRETDLGAFANAELPFERLVEILDPARSAARHPLFQVVLAFQEAGATRIELSSAVATASEVPTGTAKFDLQLLLTESFEAGQPAGIAAEFGYATDIFDEQTISGFATRFDRVLRAIVADENARVGDIDLLGADEKATLLSMRSVLDVVPRSLADILSDALDVDRAAPALIAGDETWSYAEFDEQSARLARELIGRGIGTEDTVALALTRSREFVLALFAVARTGAAFLPIDPSLPLERIAFMVADSRTRLGITVTAHRSQLPDTVQWCELDEPQFNAQVAAQSSAPVQGSDRIRDVLPDSSAYVIYTSGTTGQPKGVVVTNAGLAGWLPTYADWQVPDRVNAS